MCVCVCCDGQSDVWHFIINQPLHGDVVVFVVCCCLFPSLLGFYPTLTRWPPVLSEERHPHLMTLTLWSVIKSKKSQEIKVLLALICLFSSKRFVLLVFLVYCCHCAARLISSNSEPGNTWDPPTLETSLQHVALFINLSVAKSPEEASRGDKNFSCHGKIGVEDTEYISV